MNRVESTTSTGVSRLQMFVAALFRCKKSLSGVGSILSGEIAFQVLQVTQIEANITPLEFRSSVNPFFCSSAFSDVIVVVVVDHRGT